MATVNPVLLPRISLETLTYQPFRPSHRKSGIHLGLINQTPIPRILLIFKPEMDTSMNQMNSRRSRFGLLTSRTINLKAPRANDIYPPSQLNKKLSDIKTDHPAQNSSLMNYRWGRFFLRKVEETSFKLLQRPPSQPPRTCGIQT